MTWNNTCKLNSEDENIACTLYLFGVFTAFIILLSILLNSLTPTPAPLIKKLSWKDKNKCQLRMGGMNVTVTGNKSM